MAASSLYKNQSVLGAHLRKMKARLGAIEATTATAYKMARTIYCPILGEKPRSCTAQLQHI